MKFAQATANPGSWLLDSNDVWNIPDEVGELGHDIETQGYGWNLVTSIRALAITLDGRVFGMRKMHHPSESGYQMEGRVSIGGKKYTAFTSSKLFERPDGSLVDVGVFIVRGIE